MQLKFLEINFRYTAFYKSKKKPSYPYQNTTLENLKNENWKDISGFEGLYMASDKGKIKSSDRIIPHFLLGEQFVVGRILH